LPLVLELRCGCPEDLMREQRVGGREDGMKDIRSILPAPDGATATPGGRPSRLPAPWTMFTGITATAVATRGAGAAMVSTLHRFATP
jgi:hypothetical protein